MQIGTQPYPFEHGSDDLVPVLKSINYDYLDVQQTDADTETYVFKSGGATAVVRATTTGAASTFAANTSGIANDTATFDGYTIGQVVKALRNIGILT